MEDRFDKLSRRVYGYLCYIGGLAIGAAFNTSFWDWLITAVFLAGIVVFMYRKDAKYDKENPITSMSGHLNSDQMERLSIDLFKLAGEMRAAEGVPGRPDEPTD